MTHETKPPEWQDAPTMNPRHTLRFELKAAPEVKAYVILYQGDYYYGLALGGREVGRVGRAVTLETAQRRAEELLVELGRSIEANVEYLARKHGVLG